jgi:hypothetical protein
MTKSPFAPFAQGGWKGDFWNRHPKRSPDLPAIAASCRDQTPTLLYHAIAALNRSSKITDIAYV